METVLFDNYHVYVTSESGLCASGWGNICLWQYWVICLTIGILNIQMKDVVKGLSESVDVEDLMRQLDQYCGHFIVLCKDAAG